MEVTTKSNIWTQEPKHNEEGLRKSKMIDNMLKNDRINKLLKINVLVLSPAIRNANGLNRTDADERLVLLQKLSKIREARFVDGIIKGSSKLLVPLEEEQESNRNENHFETMNNDDDEENDEDKLFKNRKIMSVTTFASPKQDKGIKLRLSKSDASVLFYVVNILPGQAPFEKNLGKRLSGFLRHFLYVGKALGGQIPHITIGLVLTNCSELRNSLAGFNDLDEVIKYFPTLEKGHSPSEGLEAIAAEFVAASESFNPHKTEVIYVEHALTSARGSEISFSNKNISQEILNIVKVAQNEKIELVLGKDFDSQIFSDPDSYQQDHPEHPNNKNTTSNSSSPLNTTTNNNKNDTGSNLVQLIFLILSILFAYLAYWSNENKLQVRKIYEEVYIYVKDLYDNIGE